MTSTPPAASSHDALRHWNKVWSEKSPEQMSWTAPQLEIAMAWIAKIATPGARVVDIGGGASTLVDGLLARGDAVTVVDIAPAALATAKARLGAAANKVNWVEADIAAPLSLPAQDIWHDRAALHFLLDDAARAQYVKNLRDTVVVGGHVILSTFAHNGPDKCSGLPICKYTKEEMVRLLGPQFELVDARRANHLTPWGTPQSFQHALLRRV